MNYSIIQETIKRYGHKSAMYSRIYMWKEKCITKEEFDIKYGITDDSGAPNDREERDDFSVGEDLETFIRQIKNGEISKKPTFRLEEGKDLFLLCLLDKKERRKLLKNDQDFLRTFEQSHPDVPDEEWKKSKYKHLKFSQSIAFRKTFFVDTEAEPSDESPSFENHQQHHCH